MENETDQTDGGERPRDHFYHGVVSKIFWGSETGVIRSDSGKEIPFVFPLVTLLGVPRQNINFLRPGMRVGFDVCRTSKGLRASVIKIYDLYQSEGQPPPRDGAEGAPLHARGEGARGNPANRAHPRHPGGGGDHGPRRHRRERP